MREVYRTKEGFEALVNTFESMSKDYSLIVFSAFRYALGRRTYVVGVVCDYIKENIGMIESKHLPLLAAEIEDAEEYNMLGDPCDRKEWLNLKTFINDYLKRQEELHQVEVLSANQIAKGVNL